MSGLAKFVSTSARSRKENKKDDPPHQIRSVSAPPRLTSNEPTTLPQSLTGEADPSSIRIGPPVLRSDETPTPRGVIVAYTDGSCRGNYASGAGIYFGENHPLNCSQALSGPVHSSVFAELCAARIALERLISWKDYAGQKIILRSDCKSVVDGLQTGSFRDPRYTEQLSRLRLTAERFPQGVKFEHVFGHNGQLGNEAADRLASEALNNGRGRSRSMSVNRRRSRSRSRPRSRSGSRNGRGLPNCSTFVGPRPSSNGA